jgi:hypothetical protein
MNYAKWNIVFDESVTEGTVPDMVQGVLYLNELQVLGYYPDNLDTSILGKWDFTILTEQEFYDLAIAINPLITMVDGVLIPPRVDLANL